MSIANQTAKKIMTMPADFVVTSNQSVLIVIGSA
jgi:hypothetical protein